MKTNGILSGVVSRWEWDLMARKVSVPRTSQSSDYFTEVWLETLLSMCSRQQWGCLTLGLCFLSLGEWFHVFFSSRLRKEYHSIIFFLLDGLNYHILNYPNDSMTLWLNAPSRWYRNMRSRLTSNINNSKAAGGGGGRTSAFLKLIFKTGHTSFLGVPFLEITISDTQ